MISLMQKPIFLSSKKNSNLLALWKVDVFKAPNIYNINYSPQKHKMKSKRIFLEEYS